MSRKRSACGVCVDLPMLVNVVRVSVAKSVEQFGSPPSMVSWKSCLVWRMSCDRRIECILLVKWLLRMMLLKEVGFSSVCFGLCSQMSVDVFHVAGSKPVA
jgi:hypothetical protein